MNVDAKKNQGALYCYNGRLQKKIENRSVTNGLCWSNDNHTMYYIDSFDYNIKAYDFNLTTGNISNERIVVQMKTGEMPDGICIDEEDNLWVAIWGGGSVNRYNPFTGKLVGKVFIAAPHVTSCAFGGIYMTQLFITTAKEGLSVELLKQFLLSGSLFIVNTGVKGLGGITLKDDT